MGRDFSPRGHLERRERQDLSLFSGVTPRASKIKVDVPPGQHGLKGGQLSQYGKQFRAKQRAKRLYGILERQMNRYFREAMQLPGSTGEHLLRFLERRLDNAVYRLGFARTRAEARQLISHRGIMVKRGERLRTVNIPSFSVCEQDEIIVREKAKQQGRIHEALEISKERVLPEWLSVQPNDLRGLVKRMPERDEMPHEIEELLIVELYSK